MDYTRAHERNATPVPESRYTSDHAQPSDGATYQHFDELLLEPPLGAESVVVRLLYQPMTWEYIQFLFLTNDWPAGAELERVGTDLLDAWAQTGQASPVEIAALNLELVPEPAQSLMLSAGGMLLALLGRRRRPQILRNSLLPLNPPSTTHPIAEAPHRAT